MTASTTFPCVRRTAFWPAAGYPDMPSTSRAAHSSAAHLIIPHPLRCRPAAAPRRAPGLSRSNAEICQQFLLLTRRLLVAERVDRPSVDDEVVPVRDHRRKAQVLLDQQHGDP